MTEQKKKKLSILLSVIVLVILAAALIGVNKFTSPTYMLRTVLQLGAIYALVAVSMNLLNGFTGLFSLGQAGFMAIGAYVV
ncbi:MAG: branched-chain amino acid ABC transporter permease, partial [Anaerotignum sp.]